MFDLAIRFLRYIADQIPVEHQKSVLAYRENEDAFQEYLSAQEEELSEFLNVDYRDIDDNKDCIVEIK